MPDDSTKRDAQRPCTERREKAALDSQHTPRRKHIRPARCEHGGPSGPEPTRYGDWERNGRCYDF